MTKFKKFVIEHWSEILLGFMVFVYTMVMSYLSIRRHQAFASSYDLANMDQTVWNTINGNFFSLSGTSGLVSRFNYHADLILTVLSPAYLIFDRVETLLFLQSLFIALTAIPAYFLGKEVLKNKLKGLIVSAVFLLNPGVLWTNIYDFHGVALAMPLLLSTFYFAFIRKWNWMFVFAFLSVLTKESVALAIVMLGIYLIVVSKEKIKGFLLVGGGAVWFSLFVFVVIPNFSEGGKFWAWEWFNFSNSSTGGSGVNINLIVKRFLAPDVVSYLLSLIKPWALIPLLGLPWMFISAPSIVINILSDQAQMRGITLHYDSVAVVGLVMSTILGWKVIEVFFRKYKNFGWVVGCVLLLITLRANYFYSPLPTTPGHWRLMYQIGQDELDFERVLRKIPIDASITASSEVRTHLTHRVNAYNLPNMIGRVDYIAMVDQNRIVGDYNTKEFETDLIAKLSVDKEYEEVFHQGHFYLFKRIYNSISQ